MPAKTVVFVHDSPYLNPLLFRQMSGRAGRRGYDNVGKVVLFNIPVSRVHALLVSKPPALTGQLPLTVSNVLQVMVSAANTEDVDYAVHAYGSLVNLTSLFAWDMNANTKNELLCSQTKRLFRYSLEFLRSLHLINYEGNPVGLAGIAAHLWYHQPGYFFFSVV